MEVVVVLAAVAVLAQCCCWCMWLQSRGQHLSLPTRIGESLAGGFPLPCICQRGAGDERAGP